MPATPLVQEHGSYTVNVAQAAAPQPIVSSVMDPGYLDLGPAIDAAYDALFNTGADNLPDLNWFNQEHPVQPDADAYAVSEAVLYKVGLHFLSLHGPRLTSRL